MRKKSLIVTVLYFLIFSVAVAQDQPRKKVGVVLKGGGAKGFVHIGALKVLEEAGIPIDYIAGTSMGAIVGGLYAVGYDAGMLDSIATTQDWLYLLSDNVPRENLPSPLKEASERYLISLPYQLELKKRSGKLSLPSGMVMGQNLYNLFLNLTIGYQDPMHFDNLPIPFGCIAADIRTGKEVALREGVLAQAMRASMAIPGMFAPVEIDSMLLIDGGIVNNYPADLVKAMGADVVIGVDILPDKDAKEKYKGSMIEVIMGLGNFLDKGKEAENRRNTDILITADTRPYGTMSFEDDAVDTIILRGEEAAREKWDELMALKASLGITDSTPPESAIANPYIEMDSLEINSIRFTGLSPKESVEMLKRIQIKNNKITRKELETLTSQIYATGLFTRVFYQLKGDSPFDLIFEVEKKDFRTLNLGLRFDTEDIAAILANTTIRTASSLHSVIDVTARLSKNPYLLVDYYINKGIFYRGGISYTLSRNEIDVFNRGKRSHSFGITRNALNLNFSEFYFHDAKFHLGLNFDYCHFFSTLANHTDFQRMRLNNKLYINYFLEGVFDNLNKNHFPTAGQYVSFRYTLHTDNFYQMNDNIPLNVLNVRCLKPIKITDKWYITPEISGRSFFHAPDSIPLIYSNFVGGKFDGHYLPQQIALPGSGGMEILRNAFLKIQTNIHYQLTSKQCVYANLNVSAHNDKALKIFDGQYFTGANIGYSHLTVVGPLAVEIGYSDLSKKVHAYLGIGHYF